MTNLYAMTIDFLDLFVFSEEWVCNSLLVLIAQYPVSLFVSEQILADLVQHFSALILGTVNTHNVTIFANCT